MTNTTWRVIRPRDQEWSPGKIKAGAHIRLIVDADFNLIGEARGHKSDEAEAIAAAMAATPDMLAALKAIAAIAADGSRDEPYLDLVKIRQAAERAIAKAKGRHDDAS